MTGSLVTFAARSPTGCSECRRKKVKCCRSKPVCTRCSRFPRLCKYDMKFVPWANTTSKTIKHPIQSTVSSLPKQIIQPLSCHLVDDESRFYIHHFSTQTSILLFPLAPPSFRERLVSSALRAPSLLYALLAASCSHHARLACNSTSQKNILRYTNIALTALQNALASQADRVELSDVASAIVLCTNDACNGNPSSFYTHLSGAKHLLQSLVDQEHTGNENSFVQWLAKWFATLDVCASASGSYRSVITNDSYPLLETLPRPRLAQPDDLCGYSLELMPLISRIGQLANQDPSLWSSPLILDEISQLEAYTGMFYEPDKPGTLADKDPITREEKMRNTNNAFASSALLHLYRRVYQFPKDHHMVRMAIQNILRAVENLTASSTTIVLLLWPIFSAGCETDNAEERRSINMRMQHMESLGLGNFKQARAAMNSYWSSGTHLTWGQYLETHGSVFVLF